MDANVLAQALAGFVGGYVAAPSIPGVQQVFSSGHHSIGGTAADARGSFQRGTMGCHETGIF